LHRDGIARILTGKRDRREIMPRVDDDNAMKDVAAAVGTAKETRRQPLRDGSRIRGLE
jgi:hypothetical protein